MKFELFKNKITKYTLLLVLLTLVVCAMYIYSSLNEELPAYNPTDFNPELVDVSLQKTAKNHKVSDFNLINQNGETITQSDYKDKIYVADFFFTRCPSVCPIMTDNMAKIQEAFLNDEDVKLLSLSVTPEIDSISVLREYANDKGVIDAKWNVTTGNKKHIYELARKSYFATSDKGDGGLQDFIHTTHFVLVDKKKQIRGVYDGIKDEDVERLINDIKTLLN